jgi:hypothetical protein
MKMEASPGTLANSPKLSPSSPAAGQQQWLSASGPRDACPQARPNLPPTMASPPPTLCAPQATGTTLARTHPRSVVFRIYVDQRQSSDALTPPGHLGASKIPSSCPPDCRRGSTAMPAACHPQRGHTGATSGPRTTGLQRTTPVTTGPLSAHLTTRVGTCTAGHADRPAFPDTEEAIDSLGSSTSSCL